MYKRILLLICFSLTVWNSYAQVVTECPQNIGFESAAFTNWESYIGVVAGRMFPDPSVPIGTASVRPVQPSYTVSSGRMVLVKKGQGKDEYGHFSLDAPNGSDYVVRLGDNVNGAKAEKISYTYTVTKNVETYSIIFNYAVVFENTPHPREQQPKFTARVFDVTANESTDCGSFEFVAQGDLPGFEVSDVPGARGDLDVLYKPWSPVFVNLSNYIGHTIRL